jgi:homoserine dehydrogenase
VVCSAGEGGAASGGRPAQPAVRLTELEPDHPLYAAGGSTLSVMLHTDLMGTVQVAEHGALPEQTAYAVYADLLALHEGR